MLRAHPVQVRYEMLRRVRVEGHSITDTAAAFGLSRQSFYDLDLEDVDETVQRGEQEIGNA